MRPWILSPAILDERGCGTVYRLPDSFAHSGKSRFFSKCQTSDLSIGRHEVHDMGRRRLEEQLSVAVSSKPEMNILKSALGKEPGLVYTNTEHYGCTHGAYEFEGLSLGW